MLACLPKQSHVFSTYCLCTGAFGGSTNCGVSFVSPFCHLTQLVSCVPKLMVKDVKWLCRESIFRWSAWHHKLRAIFHMHFWSQVQSQTSSLQSSPALFICKIM